MPALQPLANAAWLSDADLQMVLDALKAGGGEARIAGGAVRDGLLGLPVSDIDIATTEPPDRVIELAAAAGLTTHPTGIKHGTVTVVSNHHAFEVTTLRVDVETDGRHAEVAFTDRWEIDAGRRDFTINALFCDRGGRVYDYVGGQNDLEERCVRFVGAPARRIAEDHLRILRFFRFHARYGRGEPDSDGLRACTDAKADLANLSRERIRQEFLKLLCAPGAVETIGIMERTGVLDVIMPGSSNLMRFGNHAAIEAELGMEADPIRRLAALSEQAGDAELRAAFVLSNDELKRLEALASLPPVGPAFRDAERRTLLYWHGAEAVIDKALLTWSGGKDAPGDPDWKRLVEVAQSWDAPVFPVRGQDLLDAGIDEGQELGRCLQALEDWWVAGGFSADKAALMSRLAVVKR